MRLPRVPAMAASSAPPSADDAFVGAVGDYHISAIAAAFRALNLNGGHLRGFAP